MNLAALFTLSLLLVLNAHAADEDEAEPPEKVEAEARPPDVAVVGDDGGGGDGPVAC